MLVLVQTNIPSENIDYKINAYILTVLGKKLEFSFVIQYIFKVSWIYSVQICKKSFNEMMYLVKTGDVQ